MRTSTRTNLVRRTGFSVIELLVVMAVVAALLALALPAVTRVRATSRKVSCTNHAHNLALALTQFDLFQQRLPASGNYIHDDQLRSRPGPSWAVSILPYVEQRPLWDTLDLSRAITASENAEIRTAHVPLYVCPADISRSDDLLNDQSYAVNGGIGFTTRHRNGVRDCPVTTDWIPIDLNGDGQACGGDDAIDDIDRDRFKWMGLFFLETVNSDVTRRHYSIADIKDGTSQTYLIGENVRTGYNPADPVVLGFADPAPARSSFFIGNPCGGPSCTTELVEYSRCNSDDFRINSGLRRPEGSSSTLNSFHEGGANVAFSDGHVTLVSESLDGTVHAAQASPMGLLLDGTPLAQVIAPGAGP